MLSQILPVSTLNAYIQQVLSADDILADLWVEGEITSITYAKSGHIYFKLCDDDTLIDGAMWRTFATRQAFKPRVGDSVIVHGRIDYYSAQGRLQVIAVQPIAAGEEIVFNYRSARDDEPLGFEPV